MLQAIFIDPQIKKRLEMLRRSNKKAGLAATNAQKIIKRIQSGETGPTQAGTMTKNGEARIKGVIKYDLGSGYRLVSFIQDDSCFLLYAGTHEDTCTTIKRSA